MAISDNKTNCKPQKELNEKNTEQFKNACINLLQQAIKDTGIGAATPFTTAL
jgi:hypothetical protein